MQRRELLEKMISTAVAMGLVSSCSLAFAHPADPKTEDSAETVRWLEHHLRALAARDSSEQSTPMFLALENLSTGAPANVSPVPGENAELLARFERYVDLLLQFKTNPDESDAVALVVLMAQRELVPDVLEFCR